MRLERRDARCNHTGTSPMTTVSSVSALDHNESSMELARALQQSCSRGVCEFSDHDICFEHETYLSAMLHNVLFIVSLYVRSFYFYGSSQKKRVFENICKKSSFLRKSVENTIP